MLDRSDTLRVVLAAASAVGVLACLGCGAKKSLDASPAGKSDASSYDAPTDDGTTEPDAGCAIGNVTFSLRRAPASSVAYCLGPPGTCTDSEWLSILPAGGGGSLSLVHGCVPECADSCQPIGCTLICGHATSLGDGGVTASWNGTYVLHETCGAAVACARSACAPPGQYIAHFCGYPVAPDASATSGACVGESPPTCTDVPFVWPPPTGSSVVQGELGGTDSDAGASD
jgi:hypothetical protein